MRVFISSTFDLSEARMVVAERIHSRFGWDAFCFEIDDHSLHTSLRACLRYISESDFCVGIFGTRLGTSISTEPLSFTFRELWRALAANVPTRLYIRSHPVRPSPVLRWLRGSPPRREPELEHALLPVMDEHIGFPYAHFHSVRDLADRVEADLAVWQLQGYPKPAALYAVALLSEPVTHIGLFGAPEPRAVGASEIVASTREAWEAVSSFKQLLRSEVLSTLDAECHRLLRMLPTVPLELPMTRERKEWLRVWAALLDTLKEIHNVMGETEGPWGSVSLAKAVLQLREALEDPGEYVWAVQGLGGCYYSSRRYQAAESYYEYATELTERPSYADARAVILADRASLYTRLHRTDEALKFAQESLWVTREDKRVGLTLGLLGSLELRRGIPAGIAESHYTEGRRILKDLTLSLIRIDRAWAEGLAETGEAEEATRLGLSIRDRCLAGGFQHQLLRLAECGRLVRLIP
jgi:tetratricopeptide (TPR) repeat protein